MQARKKLISAAAKLSLRYLAVASGVASFGLSGNMLRKKEGAAIVLGGVVTSAELEPTPPLPAMDPGKRALYE